ncbi:MAG: hypothetical protein ACXADO_00490 [Candidatus Thorarchaeota archaeon]
MTEERKFPRRKPAKLTTIRSLSADIDTPVRILAIVVESKPGVALVQDRYEDDVDNAGTIVASVEGKLDVDETYILIGDVTEKSGPDGKELRLAVSLAHKISGLDVKLYKQVVEMEGTIVQALIR